MLCTVIQGNNINFLWRCQSISMKMQSWKQRAPLQNFLQAFKCWLAIGAFIICRQDVQKAMLGALCNAYAKTMRSKLFSGSNHKFWILPADLRKQPILVREMEEIWGELKIPLLICGLPYMSLAHASVYPLGKHALCHLTPLANAFTRTSSP